MIIKFIILLVIIVGLIIYIFSSKKTDKEGFQTDIITTPFFNIDYKYYSLKTSEEAAKIPYEPDTLILDVGGAFGEFDASKMPWDSENKELTQEEVLWGIVPGDASTALFKKIYLANQIQDPSALPFDEETNEYYYQDPLFQYGTDNASLATGLQIVNAVAQFAVPMIIETLHEEINVKPAAAAKKARQEAVEMLANSDAKFRAAYEKALQPSDLKKFNKAKLNNVTSKAGAGKEAGKVADDAVEMMDNPMKKGTKGSVKSAKASGEFLRQGASWGGKFKKAGFFKKIVMLIKAAFGKKGAKLVAKGLLAGLFVTMTLQWIPVAGPYLDAAYNFIVTPLLIILSLPNGPITQAMDKWADSDGACPTGSIPLDQILPEWAMVLVSFVPIIGDILDLFYPFLCSQRNTGLLVTKGPFILPKYIEYPWLSTYFWGWPSYNARYRTPALQGKYLPTQFTPSVPGYMSSLPKTTGSNATYDLYDTPYIWTYGPYLNYDDVVRDGNTTRFDNIDKKLVGAKPEFKTQTFWPASLFPPGAKFFYADFSDPTMLVQMAQFYYDYSIRNPKINEDDGSYNIEIISKINYVIASSIYSCDIECEILNVTYNPTNGTKYNEYITLEHDRRFYFGVNYNNNAPNYWENSNNIEWVRLDDRYDNAMYNLTEYLHRPQTFRINDLITAELFVSAYEDIKNTGTVLSNLTSTSNYTQDDYRALNSNYLLTLENYDELISLVIKNTNSYGFDTRYRERLEFRVSTVVGVKEEMWELQKRLRPVSEANKHPQYKIYGCTHLNDTAGSACPPDIGSFQVDYRKRVQFEVLPYLSRCKDNFIGTNQCIDLSNVEQIIKMYKDKYPNKDIKSIVDIKAQGKNVCQFTWDEVTTGQNDMTRKEYKFLYQTDLSSCTFCLPNTLIAEGSSDLPAIESIKMYKNPITDSNEQIYNPEYNTRLQYRKAFYYQPTITSNALTRSVSFTKVENIDTIPRIDPNTYAVLPELVRPKKPIRVTYPSRPQSYLGTNSNDLCSNPETLQRFILDYNATNPANKILSVVKAYTVDNNTCDLSVDMLIKQSSNNNTVQRRTVSFNVKPATEGFANVYTYDSIDNNDALLIRPGTPYLDPPYSETGVTYGRPFLNNFNPTVQSNIMYFDNQLVTDYTKNTQGILKNTRDLLLELKDTQFLADDPTNCQKKCDDREIMQRIMEQYNNDNQAKGRYDQEIKTMYTIFKSATESADKCHLYFAQTTDNYGDLYAANKNNSNNYLTESKVALRAVNMRQLPGTCQFVPVVGQTYVDISASDVALQSGVDVFANDSNFYTPARQNCTNLNCRDANLLNAAIDDYTNVTGSSVTRVFKTLKVTNDTCDYSIIQNLVYDGEVVPDIESVLRVRYKYPIFDKDNTTNCAPFTYQPATVFNEETYKSDTFELQFSENIDDDDPDVSPILSYIDNTNDPISNLIQNIP